MNKHQVGWHLKYSQKLTSKKNSHKIYSFCVPGKKNPSCDILGHKHTKPPKTIITSIIFLQLFCLVMYGHHILNYFFLF